MTMTMMMTVTIQHNLYTYIDVGDDDLSTLLTHEDKSNHAFVKLKSQVTSGRQSIYPHYPQ